MAMMIIIVLHDNVICFAVDVGFFFLIQKRLNLMTLNDVLDLC